MEALITPTRKSPRTAKSKKEERGQSMPARTQKVSISARAAEKPFSLLTVPRGLLTARSKKKERSCETRVTGPLSIGGFEQSQGAGAEGQARRRGERRGQ